VTDFIWRLPCELISFFEDFSLNFFCGLGLLILVLLLKKLKFRTTLSPFEVTIVIFL